MPGGFILLLMSAYVILLYQVDVVHVSVRFGSVKDIERDFDEVLFPACDFYELM